MDALPSRPSFEKARHPDRGPEPIAPDCAGQNFYAIDRGLRDLLQLYLEPNDFRRLEPHFDRLGVLAGGRLDELARVADKHPPVLNPRDRFGRDEDWIDYHSSYRKMEQIAFGDFQFHAMSHRPGTLGMDRQLPAVAKYALQYLFVQAEFGLMCPISVTDTSIHLPKMLSGDVATMWKGTQFMTERAGGSDVGAIETTARCEDGEWRLYGDKWFCSHADADVALLLARPEGAPDGTRGLALFALPRRLKSGRRNAYRIVRLKDKLGTRSMASGEILLEGAVAYLVGEAERGFKQMMEQVNLSRLSHGVRAAAMMRRCVNEAMVCARSRVAFGKTIIEYALLRRQLLKVIVPTEQALSMFLFTANAMDRANAGSKEAESLLRILTALLKFRACRDNIPVATGAMEVRGGNGYIEDIVTRAVGKSRAHRTLEAELKKLLDQATLIPAAFRDRLRLALDRTLAFAERVAADAALEASARQVASSLYHVTSAILMIWEAAQPGADARRSLYARFVLEHRLSAQDPLQPRYGEWERKAEEFVFSERQGLLAEIAGLLEA